MICYANTILCVIIDHVIKYYTFTKLRRILKGTEILQVSQSSPACLSDENTMNVMIITEHGYKR